MLPSRRALLAGAAALAATLRTPARAEAGWSHGLSTFGELALPPDFPHLPYADPAAPKGGAISMQIEGTAYNQAFNTFNTLNIFVLRGDGAAGMGLTFDTLMARNADEPDGLYGLLAEAVRLAPDRRTIEFRLREGARFHDGTAVTAADAAFTIELLRKRGHPSLVQVLREVEGAEATSARELRVTFSPRAARDLPLVVAGLPVLSSAYYATREFDASTLEPPLGSGPYRVGSFEQGRFISFTRDPDYWGRDLPVNRGQNNFDTVRFEYFRDRQIAFEAFKAGAFTFREEFTSRLWATGYDFPAINEGRVRREVLPNMTPSGAQGWLLNTRREALRDPRVREAIGLAFDFEWTNASVMYGAYRRTASWFENSPMKAEGVPSAAELALLEPWRGKVSAEVFGEPYLPPVSDGSGQDRALLRRADALLRAAGLVREGRVLKLPGGAPLALEFLDYDPSLEPHTAPFLRNLALLGIDARIRRVDQAQYQRRVEEFDFDVVTRRTALGVTPGEGLRTLFGSASATVRGSPNLPGIADPAIDAVIGAALAASTRAELTTACRALDRLLRAGRYWVPMWFKAEHWLAVWDEFGRPERKPLYGRGAPDTWWHDPERAKRIGRG